MIYLHILLIIFLNEPEIMCFLTIKWFQVLLYNSYFLQTFVNWITMTRKSGELWTAVSTLLGLISSIYRDLHIWRSNQRPQIA